MLDIGSQPPGASYVPADRVLSRRTCALAVSGPLHGNQTGRKVKFPDSLSGFDLRNRQLWEPASSLDRLTVL